MALGSADLVSALRAQGLKLCSPVLSHYVGAGNLNSGLHACGQACIDRAVSPAPTVCTRESGTSSQVEQEP